MHAQQIALNKLKIKITMNEPLIEWMVVRILYINFLNNHKSLLLKLHF